MDYMAIIGMVTQLMGAAAGQAAAQMDKDEMMRLIKKASDNFGKIQIPKLKELFLAQQKKSGLSDIKDDPKYRDQQNAADSQLNDIITSGGLTLADKAALNAIRNRTARTESAGRNAITNDMAARGSLDSGAQVAMQLQGNQQSANSLAAADEWAAGQGHMRSFQAVKERANLAGQGLDRSYRQRADAARADDAINAGNVAIMNTASMYNAGIPQRDFNNQMALAVGQTNANAGLAGAFGARAKDTQQNAQNIANIAASGLKSLGSFNATSPGQPQSSNDYAGRGSPSDLSGGHTDQELRSSEPTKPPGAPLGANTSPDGRPIIGWDAQGNPVYGQPQGQNF